MIEPPDILYHYTTAQGLMGILSSNTLWASNLICMNDFSELKYSTDLIENGLRKALELCDSKFSNHLLSTEDLTPFTAVSDKYSVYACCFCEDGDSLSQWRTYAGKATGYALGFDTKKLLAFLERGNLRRNLKRIIYCPEEQIRLIEPEVMECLKRVPGLPENREERYKTVVGFWADLYKRMFPFLYSFKNPAFSEEREWRIVVPEINDQNIEEIKFRELRGIVVPYVELRFPSGNPDQGDQPPVVEIVQGPLMDPAWGEKSLRLLLRKLQYASVEVRRSKVPIRF